MFSTSTQFYADPMEIFAFVADISRENSFFVLAYKDTEEKPVTLVAPESASREILSDLDTWFFALVADIENADLTRHQIFEEAHSAILVNVGAHTDGTLTESQIVTRTFNDSIQKNYLRIQRKLRRLMLQGAWVTTRNVREFYRNLRYTDGAMEFAKKGCVICPFRSDTAPLVDLLAPPPVETKGRVIEHLVGTTWTRDAVHHI